jgi:hypothetical protein
LAWYPNTYKFLNCKGFIKAQQRYKVIDMGKTMWVLDFSLQTNGRKSSSLSQKLIIKSDVAPNRKETKPYLGKLLQHFKCNYNNTTWEISTLAKTIHPNPNKP